MIIWFSSHSSKLSTFIGKRNPVATLATLILLSYTKLLETVIRSLSFVSLNYPNGTRVIKWLPDPSYAYSDWKIVLLVCLAIVILSFGLVYTFLTFSWQWLVRVSGSKFFKWTRNQKLHAFIDTHHTPNTARHRYWTGLLLLVRVIVYLIPAFSVSVNPRISLLSTALIMCSLLLYKTILTTRVYRNWLLNVIESFVFFNITTLAFFTSYTFSDSRISSKDSDTMIQSVAAYASVGTICILFLSVVAYHLYRYGSGKVYSFCQGTKLAMKFNRRILYADNLNHQIPLDGSAYRLFDFVDNPRCDDSGTSSGSALLPSSLKPTQSTVSLGNCDDSCTET